MEPSSKIKRQHRLAITLEDVAQEAGVSMDVMYSDVKRGKVDKDDLHSVISYILSKNGDISCQKRIFAF